LLAIKGEEVSQSIVALKMHLMETPDHNIIGTVIRICTSNSLMACEGDSSSNISTTCVLQVGEGLVCLTHNKGVAIDENQGLFSQVLPVHAALACNYKLSHSPHQLCVHPSGWTSLHWPKSIIALR
jgi:hypothetical protein